MAHATLIERAFGDVHAQCTRHHQRKRFHEVIRDGERQLHANGPWSYQRSRLSQALAVPAAGERIAAAAQAKSATYVYESYAL